VLLTADGLPGLLAAVRGLAAAGYEPWLATSQPDTYAARSRFTAGYALLSEPHEDPEAFASRLAQVAVRIGAAAVLPGTEATLRALTGREELFEGIPVGTSTHEALERATSKAELVSLAGRHGLLVPPSLTLATAELADAEIQLPVVVKPLQSVPSTRDGRMLRREPAMVVESRHVLRQLAGGSPDISWVLQPFIEGELSAVSGVAWQGKMLSALHQISPRIWPQPLGTSAYAETRPPDVELEHRTEKLLSDLGWSGIYNLQTLRRADGVWLIDLNPRIYGSLGLALVAGHNLAAAWVDLLLGRLPSLPPYRQGVGLQIEEKDYKALAAEAAAGHPLLALGRRRRRGTEVHRAVVSLRDPAPGLVGLHRLGRKWRQMGAT